MVHIEELRAGFSRRLKKAIVDAGWDERGRGDRLAGLTSVTPKAASKWLNEESIPRQDRLLAIADELGVSACWLEYGEKAFPPGKRETIGVESPGGEYNAQREADSRLALLVNAISTGRRKGHLTDDDLRMIGQMVKTIAVARSTK